MILYAAAASPSRIRCLEILDAVVAGEIDGRTSTAALEEVWYLEASGRLGDLEGLTRSAYAIFAPLLAVTDEAFQIALDIAGPALGPNDRLHAGVCVANGIEVVVSADADFDGVASIRRVDPGADDALRVLQGR